MRNFVKLWLPTVFALALAGHSNALTIPASEDTTSVNRRIQLGASNATSLTVDPTHVPLVYFNLDDIPKDTVVRFARLRLYLPSVKDRGAGIGVHQVTGLWNEAVEGAQPAYQATPLVRFEGTKLGARRFVTVDVTSLVQRWINLQAMNEGFALTSLPTGNRSIAPASVTIAAKEGAGLGLPAQLEIELSGSGQAGPQGPKGDTGPQGPRGLQGIQGPKGDAASIGVGRITADMLSTGAVQSIGVAVVESITFTGSGTASSLAALLSPKITTQPTVLVSDEKIVAAVDGLGPFAYQWYRNGIPLVGRTESTLSLINLSSGTYNLRVSNGISSVNSDRVEFNPSQATLGIHSLISAGSFSMGSDELVNLSSLPVHPVYVSAFYLSRRECSYSEWVRVRNWASSNGYSFENIGAGSDLLPVTNISWYDAVKWCNAKSEMEGLTPCYYTGTELNAMAIYRSGRVDLSNEMVDWSASGYRLPTEAEWEKAARGGLTGKSFPYPEVTWIESRTGWYTPQGNFGADTLAPTVGDAYPANGFGLYAMSGNVSEMCWDQANDYNYSFETDPRGGVSNFEKGVRVVRGGSFGRDAKWCTVSVREKYGPTNASKYTGFRVARRALP